MDLGTTEAFTTLGIITDGTVDSMIHGTIMVVTTVSMTLGTTDMPDTIIHTICTHIIVAGMALGTHILEEYIIDHHMEATRPQESSAERSIEDRNTILYPIEPTQV